MVAVSVREGIPVIVAEAEGIVLGSATLGDFRSWPGYRFTVEATIHLRPEARRQGTGTLLLKELISKAESRQARADRGSGC